MQLQQRINAFVALGRFLGQFGPGKTNKQEGIPQNDLFFDGMLRQITLAEHHNGWFTHNNILFAVSSWAEALSEENLQTWISNYNIPESKSKTIAIIMAGNVPLVGFHDFLSVLLTGHKVLGKLSSNDKQLLPYLANYLIAVEPEFKDHITFTEEKMENFEAVIATGSNNTARYFDYYFGKYPHIIRKNRNSVAILTGDETPEELEALADDIFRYFGLGCRNVSKIYVPENYNFDAFFNGIFSWKEIVHNNKYINNYDYNKAVYLMSAIKLLDNEFLLLKEDEGFSSPISVVFYEYYKDTAALDRKLGSASEEIQCIVSRDHIPFGKGQSPMLWDYADGVDTVAFLLKLS
ncbi:acyl-CoA reductase LuxC [Ulvibacter sp. MAR_2010_11]|uniref:acyl-CoA reductase n=1 Tax=Ulvibacter sp. MAR_2010_11 TaxID=1250229 RepID=UPI000C2C8C2A|nr:acyl-CoA reductase [Ulvibacter sp. MAR_2010_11]PKA84072.1 acyl-CoA reductase LuxC [Ulvibacter sp. MAR_2010_11]